MRDNNLPRAVLVISMILGLITWICLVSEAVSIDYCGFDIDSSGTLYVARGCIIDVVSKGKIVGTIRHPDSQHYAFEIENDQLVFTDGIHVVTTSLDGSDEISRKKDPNGVQYDRIKKKKVIVDHSGVQYKANSVWGRIIITQGDDVVYRTPFCDYLVKCLFLLNIPVGLISMFLVKYRT